MRRSTTWRRTAFLLTSGLALMVALAGCSSATRSSAGTADAGAPAQGAAPAGAPGPVTENLRAAPAAPTLAQGGAAAGKPDLPNAAAGRSIVYNGSITVRVTDVTAAASQLTTLAIGAGGLVSGEERQTNDGKSTDTITLRIPAAQFSDILNQVGKLGRELSRRVSTEDVTATVIDLNARIQSQQASVDRVRALLARAQSISDITSIEAELARREADLESMQSQQRNLADLTALSTIAVTLLGPEAATPPPAKPKETGFLAGLKSGWKAFTASVSVILTVLGAVLPFALAIGIPAWAVVLWVRWRNRRLQPTTATAPPSSETAAPKAESTM